MIFFLNLDRQFQHIAILYFVMENHFTKPVLFISGFFFSSVSMLCVCVYIYDSVIAFYFMSHDREQMLTLLLYYRNH